MYRNTALSQAMNEGFAVRDQVQSTVQAEMDAASRNNAASSWWPGVWHG